MDHRYTHWLSVTLLFLISFFNSSFAYSADIPADSPVGYWKTIDDITGKPKSIIQIWKTKDNVLMGKVVKIFSKDGSDTQNKLCSSCRGDKHNQPIVGMVILTGLTVKEHQWDNGRIINPENGKTYRCAIRAVENGEKLNVRGYMGLPLLGRSQIWERVDLMSG